MVTNINSQDKIINLFPTNADAIDALANNAINEAKKSLDFFYNLKDQKTFANTFEAFDSAVAQFNIVASIIHVIKSVHPDEQLRNAANHNSVKLSVFAIDNFWQNKEIYKLLEDAKQHLGSNLNTQEIYYIKHIMHMFKRNGLHLQDSALKRLADIQKELAERCLNFETNIATDSRRVEVEFEQLDGLSNEFIESLSRSKDGKYILTLDYPTYFSIIEQCKIGSTRKALYQQFTNRAYPANDAELAQIIALRDEFSKLVGFESYAALDTGYQMAENPNKVEDFLNNLLNRSKIKFDKEVELLKTYVSENLSNIKLSQNGKFNSWDIPFIKSEYKKKFLNIDEDEISQYFPLEHTVDKLLEIYQKFLGLNFKKNKAAGLWDENVEAVSVYKNEKLLGTLLLDLFPRAGKFTHACHITIMPTVNNKKGFEPALSLVLANFPKPIMGHHPALLKRTDVITFFHEFGHAIHAILGSTQMFGFSGTDTMWDFVEMPSQMLEEWMWQPEILKFISKHWQTGLTLTDKQIDQIVKLKHFDSGFWLHRQIFYSLLSLEYFKQGAYKNIQEIFKKLYLRTLPAIEFMPDNHDYAAFGHLTDYGAKYYGYLWSRVFAVDIFEYLKKFGLFSNIGGELYIEKVLSKGGSVHPAKLLRDLLGRDVQADAFFKDLGI